MTARDAKKPVAEVTKVDVHWETSKWYGGPDMARAIVEEVRHGRDWGNLIGRLTISISSGKLRSRQ